MSEPTWIERWVARFGGRLILILLVVGALVQIVRIWRSGGF